MRRKRVGRAPRPRRLRVRALQGAGLHSPEWEHSSKIFEQPVAAAFSTASHAAAAAQPHMPLQGVQARLKRRAADCVRGAGWPRL